MTTERRNTLSTTTVRRRPLAAVAAVLAVTAALVSGCGSSGGSDAPSTSRVPTTVAVKTAASITRSTPVSFAIPSINAAGSLISVGLNTDGSVQVPADYQQAAWYQQGPAPGEQGSSVILGHVDSYKGPGVFFALKKVKKDDMIDVTRADGKVAHFKVTDVRMYLKSEFPDQTVFGPRGGATLQVVTCGGDFDKNAKSYLSNVVVFSSLDSVT